MVKVEARLAELGIELPDVIAPKGQYCGGGEGLVCSRNQHAHAATSLHFYAGNYALSVRTGNLLFLGKQCKPSYTAGRVCLLSFIFSRSSPTTHTQQPATSPCPKAAPS